MKIEEAINILDVDSKDFKTSCIHEKREAIELIRKKLLHKSKKRFSYIYEYNWFKNDVLRYHETKNAYVETLHSASLKERFRNYIKIGDPIKVITVRVVVRDSWNNNKLIYDGTNYEDFLKEAKKYDK